MQKRHIYLSVLFLIIVGMIYAANHKAAPPRYGYIKSVTQSSNGLLLEIDPFDMLTGEEAIKAGIEDTDCTRENIKDCIPSLENDFYIRNVDVTQFKYKTDPRAIFSIFINFGSPEIQNVSAQMFTAEFSNPQNNMTSQPFKFTSKGKNIILVEEQYTP